tara:strand:- start:378 stop:725 length:348 start_codon:yes stop_codon:yes gene_type:complete
MSESSPTPREFLEAFLPGLFQLKVLTLSLGAGLLSVALVVMALTLFLSPKGQIALAVGGLMCWGHGAAWLVNGEVESVPSALANFAGAKWGVFFALWWAPIAAGWIVFGTLAQEA